MGAARAPRLVPTAMVGAVLAWALADVVHWFGPTTTSVGVAAEVVHLLADLLLGIAVWAMGRAQRPQRPRAEVAETLLVVLAVSVPVWLLWLRPRLEEAVADTVGGAPVLALHLLVLASVLGVVVWHLVGDVLLSTVDELVRAALVLLVLVDLGPVFPGGAAPLPLDVALEAVRLALAAWLAATVVRHRSLVDAREGSDRRWSPQLQRLVAWVGVALVGPLVLAGGALAGDRDRHAIAVAVLASVAGIVLLGAREWWVLQDARNDLGRERRRAARQSRRARTLAERERARATFLGAASHDLRTPLMAVRGSAELLATHDERIPSHRRQELLQSLVRNADRLEHLLAALLDVERLSSGAIRARREQVDVLALAREVASLPHLRDVRVEVGAGSLEAVVDPLMVERILDNLLLNAVRHTPVGTPVWVEAHPGDAGGVRLVVSDAGPGIPEEERERVLEAFSRLDRSREVPGTGLGLSLVEGFARLHGGHVDIGDRPGGGARFEVELPGPRRRPPSSEAGRAAASPVPAVALPEPMASRLRTRLEGSLDDEHAVDVARGALLQAAHADEVLGVVAALVAHLGGELVPSGGSSLARTGLQLAVGEGPPLQALARTRAARARLRAHLGPLLDDAHRLAWLLAAVRRRPVANEVLETLDALPELQRSRWLTWAEEARVGPCIDLVREVARREASVSAACGALLEPAQLEAGRRWQEGRWAAAQEHVVTGVVEGALGALEADLPPERPSGTLLAVCAVGEAHVVPLRMASLAWREAGWQVHLVGHAPPRGDLAAQLERSRPSAVMVSCTVSWLLPGCVDVVAVAHEAGVPVVLGGRALDPAGRRGLRLGADASAPDPRTALEVVAARGDVTVIGTGPTLDAEVAEVVQHGDRIVEQVVRRAETVGVGAVSRGCVEVVLRAAAAARQVDDPVLLDEATSWLAATRHLRTRASEGVEDVLELVAAHAPSELVGIRGLIHEVLVMRAADDRRNGPRDGGAPGVDGRARE